MNAYIHAENMKIYAEDATKSETPWELWECQKPDRTDWISLETHPGWAPLVKYRRRLNEVELIKDAARYSWLRKNWFAMTATYSGSKVTFRTDQDKFSNLSEEEIDKEIDAHIAKENK